jgi:RAB protein geranylgeranyltransferase component A
MALVSSRHGVAKDGKYLAWISTTVETQTPETGNVDTLFSSFFEDFLMVSSLLF